MPSADGTIRRQTRFPQTSSEWILSGPHFHVGKSALTKHRVPSALRIVDYDLLDLTALPDDYLPRTNYVPACDAETYIAAAPRAYRGVRSSR